MNLQSYLKETEFAVDTLAGGLLQIAKQGISIVHGNPHNCPSGRRIGSLTLKSII